VRCHHKNGGKLAHPSPLFYLGFLTKSVRIPLFLVLSAVISSPTARKGRCLPQKLAWQLVVIELFSTTAAEEQQVYTTTPCCRGKHRLW